MIWIFEYEINFIVERVLHRTSRLTIVEIFIKKYYSKCMTFAKPFIKWVGGKSQILEEIRSKYPSRIEKYCEPFVGGGAVLFDILQKSYPEKVLINDINKELINTYQQLRDNSDSLIELLSDLQKTYKLHTTEENKILFYEKRDRYNELKVNGNETENLEKAALFIFLNKTSFNGLYRVNLKGLFNVPFNNARNPLLCDEENLQKCSKLLQNVEMITGDYSKCKDFIDEKTFVYIDPPYRPLTQTSAFTSYNENGFDDKEQIRLGKFIREISEKGAKILASNSDPKNADENDDFIEELYKPFEISHVYATRAVNSKGSGRGKISELLISNFSKPDYIPIEQFLEESLSKFGTILHKFDISKISVDKSRFCFCNEVIPSEVDNIAYYFHKESWEPVTLDREYFLRDGQHRLAAAKKMGLKYIDAIIYNEDLYAIPSIEIKKRKKRCCIL